MKVRGIALLLALPISAAGALSCAGITASAGVAPPYFQGAAAANALPMADSPVIVEREEITLTVPEFPKESYSCEEFSDYGASVTSTYTLYNPTEEDVELDFAFPLGYAPAYAPVDKSYDFYADTARYCISADGENVPLRVRHSYDPYAYNGDGGFSVETGAKRLSPERSSFYAEGTPVTVYEFSVSVGGAEQAHMSFNLCFDCKPRRTRVFCSENAQLYVENGRGMVVNGFNAKETPSFSFKVYAVGEPLVRCEWGVYRYQSGEITEVEGAAVSVRTSETDFYTVAMENYPAGSKITQADWYNAFIDMLEEREVDGCMSHATASGLGGCLMQWYEYTLTIPAGGRVNNSVTSPIYPTLDGGGLQKVYTYNFLLSPAQHFADFGEIKININTAYHISDSSLEFTRQEGGYVFERDCLPQGELRFSLTENERTYGYYALSNPPDSLAIMLVALSVLLVGAAVTVTVLIVTARRRRKSEEALQSMGRAQEGKVDLPPEDEE